MKAVNYLHLKQLGRLNQEIKSEKKRFKDFFDFSPGCYFTLSRNGAIQAVNLAGSNLLGIERKLLIGKQLINYVTLYEQPIFCNHVELVFTKKTNDSCEVELLRKGNIRFQVKLESYYCDNNTIVMCITNIAKEKQLEATLNEIRKTLFLFDNLFQYSADALSILDENFYFKIINQSFIQAFSTIFSTRVNVGANLLMILADFPDWKENILLLYHKAKEGQRSSILIENNNHAAYYCYEVYFNMIKKNHDGQNDFTVMAIRDLTEHKLHQRQQLAQQTLLTQATRVDAVGEMAAALAHEINQPLAAMHIYSRGCLEQFKALNMSSTKLEIGLNKIAELATHAGEILHRMKNFIRQGELDIDEIDINKLIKQAIILLDYKKSDITYEVQYHLASYLPHVWVDKIKITQVIINLTQNSIEAIRDKASHLVIQVITKRLSNFIEITFKDNGPGIPKELIDKVMKSYFTTKPQGTGLGLAICRTLIEAHGGKLIIQPSEEGACFSFTLPIKECFS